MSDFSSQYMILTEAVKLSASRHNFFEKLAELEIEGKFYNTEYKTIVKKYIPFIDEYIAKELNKLNFIYTNIVDDIEYLSNHIISDDENMNDSIKNKMDMIESKFATLFNLSLKQLNDAKNYNIDEIIDDTPEDNDTEEIDDIKDNNDTEDIDDSYVINNFYEAIYYGLSSNQNTKYVYIIDCLQELIYKENLEAKSEYNHEIQTVNYNAYKLKQLYSSSIYETVNKIKAIVLYKKLLKKIKEENDPEVKNRLIRVKYNILCSSSTLSNIFIYKNGNFTKALNELKIDLSALQEFSDEEFYNETYNKKVEDIHNEFKDIYEDFCEYINYGKFEDLFDIDLELLYIESYATIIQDRGFIKQIKNENDKNKKLNETYKEKIRNILSKPRIRIL